VDICDLKMSPLSPSTFPSLGIATVLMQHPYICLTWMNALGMLEEQISWNCTEIWFLIGINLTHSVYATWFMVYFAPHPFTFKEIIAVTILYVLNLCN